MKKSLYAATFTIMLTGFSATAFAQDNQTEPAMHSSHKWISQMGYWVVESNIHILKHNIVYYRASGMDSINLLKRVN
jgi:hypothetical protein